MEKRELERDKNYVLVEYAFDEDEIKKAEERAVRRLNRIVEVPGFRKGRVPKGVLKMRLGKDFDYYVLEELEREIFQMERRENLLLKPLIVDEKLEDGKAIVRIEYHHEPDVELPNPEDAVLRIAKKEPVLEKYVDKRLRDLREEHALVEPKDEPAQVGDLVRVRMKVTTKDGKVLRDEEYEYVLVEGDKRPFVQELIGKKAGDVVEFDREYEGKTFHYEIEVLQVYSRTLMELDDEFARTVSGEFDTLEKLKSALMEEGEKIYEVERKNALRNQALAWLAENSELIISEKTIERLVESAIEKIKEDGKYEEYLEKFESEENLRDTLKSHYIEDLKGEYSVKGYAKKNDIQVGEEEVMEEAEALSQLWGISPQRAKALVKNDPELRYEIEWTLLKNKVADDIISKAKIEEFEPEEGEDEKDE